jgi:sugar-phosphatase
MVKAVIFDMDGVLVDSEPFWRSVMIKGFKTVGLNLTEADCRKTTGMRLDEVIEFWKNNQSWENKTSLQLHDEIIDDLCKTIEQKGIELKGTTYALNFFKLKNLKIGLASSSNNKLINTVIKKLGITHFFNAVHSAENLPFGKPHPQVFLNCADSLEVLPTECLVIEDSVNGIIAAKAAKMFTIAIPDNEHRNDKRFVIADLCLNNLTEINEQSLSIFNL